MKQFAGGKTEQDLLRFLHGITFPAHKDDVIHAARKNGAPNDIVGTLQELPENEFATAEELLRAYPGLD